MPIRRKPRSSPACITRSALPACSPTVAIAASDETGVGEALATVTAFAASTDQPFAKIGKINVHGYSGTDTNPYRGALRPNLRNAARAAAPGATAVDVGIRRRRRFGHDDGDQHHARHDRIAAERLGGVAGDRPVMGVFRRPRQRRGDRCGLCQILRLRAVQPACAAGLAGSSATATRTRSPPTTGRAASLSSLPSTSTGRAGFPTTFRRCAQAAGPIDRWETTTVGGHTAKGYVHATDTALSGKAFRFRCEANAVYTFEISGVIL